MASKVGNTSGPPTWDAAVSSEAASDGSAASRDAAVTDADAFRAAMGDVAPLDGPPRVLAEPLALRVPNEPQLARRRAAEEERARDANHLHSHGVVPLLPHDVVAWKKDGVQPSVFRKLRMADYPIQDALDLHRMRLHEARGAVFGFITRAVARGLRVVQISHGKGLHGEEPGLLKSHVAWWLPQLPDVVALHSAQRRHGGTGALYVLLRKGELAREDNRELHRRKGHTPHTL